MNKEHSQFLDYYSGLSISAAGNNLLKALTVNRLSQQYSQLTTSKQCCMNSLFLSPINTL